MTIHLLLLTHWELLSDSDIEIKGNSQFVYNIFMVPKQKFNTPWPILPPPHTHYLENVYPLTKIASLQRLPFY